MKNKLAVLFINALVFVLITLFLSGCWGSRELKDLSVVIGMGVDSSQTPGGFSFIAQIVKPGEMKNPSSDEGGDGGKAYWNVKSTGETIFEAVRDITHKTGNRLFVSHSEVVVFGRDIAEEGLQKYIDFFLRAHEMRPTSSILIAQKTAEEVLDAKPQTAKLPAMNIKKLVKSYGFKSETKNVNLQDFSSGLLSRTKCPVAPLVGAIEEDGEKNIYVSGLAVFKGNKMVGTLSHMESRGFLWIIGEVKSGVINIDVPGGHVGKAALEILKAESKLEPEIKNGRVYFKLSVKAETGLAEQTCPENLATVAGFKLLEKSQEEAIRKKIMAAFEKSKELNADIFGFGEMLGKKYRKEWKQMENNWDNIYEGIELTVDVETIIRKTDLLTKPATPEGEGKQ